MTTKTNSKQETKQEKKKGKWASIRVPREVKERLEAIAKKKGIAMWRVLLEALSHYEALTKKPKEKMKLPRLDKASWYAYKLSQSIGAFKEKPSLENLYYLDKTISQIEERAGINCRILRKIVVEVYELAKKKKQIPTQLIIELNDTAKLIVGDILYRYLFEEEQK